MRQRFFLAAAVAALAAGMGSATAGPQDAAPAVPVQYFGDDWGPRGYYEREIEPYRPRRWATPDDDDEDMGLIAPQRVMAIARSMGHRPISRPRLAGRAWVVEAVGPRGQRTRLTINAYTGAPMAIRELEQGGERFPTPPVWRDERPSFGRDTAPPPQQPDMREGRLDNDPSRLDRQPETRPDTRPDLRPSRPAPNITARAVPVPLPRPNIDGTPPLSVEPQVPFTPPAAEPPAAALPQTPPRRVGPAPPMPAEPPAAAPVVPSEPPAAALPQTPPRRVGPVPAPMPAEPPAAVPAAPAEPPAAALPQAPPPAEPPAVIPAPAEPEAPPPPAAETTPATPEAAPPSAETAQTPPSSESDGVMIDGRFLGPNGEQLPSGPGQTSPGVRQVTPPSSGN